MRVGFCVSGLGRAALHTITYLQRTRPNINFFVLLGASANSNLESILGSLGIEFIRLRNLKGSVQLELEKVMLHESPCDYWVLTFRHLIPSSVVRPLTNRIINLHPTLLPSFAGLHGLADFRSSTSVIQGATCHFVDEGVDTGPIISTFIMPRDPNTLWNHSEVEFGNGLKILHTQTTIWLIEGCISMIESRPRVVGRKYDSLPFVPKIDDDELFLTL